MPGFEMQFSQFIDTLPSNTHVTHHAISKAGLKRSSLCHALYTEDTATAGDLGDRVRDAAYSDTWIGLLR